MLHELVAGESEDDEVVRVVGLDFLVELLEAFELRGEAALGGRVDDEDDFVFEAREGVGLAFFCWAGAVRIVGKRVGRGGAVGRLECW